MKGNEYALIKRAWYGRLGTRLGDFNSGTGQAYD